LPKNEFSRTHFSAGGIFPRARAAEPPPAIFSTETFFYNPG
jgi:hypothetical protein